MKKFLSLVLALLMLLSLCAVPALGEDEVPEISWLISVGNTADENNLVLQEIEKTIGVKVSPIQCATGDFDSKLNTLIAARDLPDLFSIGLADALEFIDEGMLLPLDDLLPEYGQNILSVVGDLLPSGKANQVDGTYMILKGNKGIVNNFGVRADWLKNLDMEVPTDLDSLYDALYAFTYNDPDGNGVDDTIGIVMTMTQSNQWEHIFGAFGIAYNKAMQMEDGTVTTYMKHPKYLEAIEYLRKLYQAGVMDPEFATMPAMTAHEALWTGRCGAYGFQFVGTTNNWYPGRYTFEVPEDPAELFAYTSITGPDGKDGSPALYPNVTSGFVVSSMAENPEAVVKFVDFLFTPEGDELTYLGVEGVMYEWTDEENGKYTRLSGYEDDAAHRAAGGFTFWMNCLPVTTEIKTMNAHTQAAQAFGWEHTIEWACIDSALESSAEYGDTLNQIVNEALAQLIVSTGDYKAEYAEFVARWESEGGLEYEAEATEVYNAQLAAAQ